MGVLTFSLTCVSAAGPKTQLCMVLDGSGSIDQQEWLIIKRSVAKAINETLPHDGSVELSIVEFGYISGGTTRIEVSPTTVNNTNYVFLAERVMAMPRGGGDTHLAAGLNLGWRIISQSPNFGAAPRQAIYLFTDETTPGMRNLNATRDLDGDGRIDAHDDVIAVVNKAVAEGLDELDVMRIGPFDIYYEWFKNWAVWPQPGVKAPPFAKSGWIQNVENGTEFVNALSEQLKVNGY